MKLQLIQKLFVFIVCMMFSSSFLHAQKCNGPNKILMCYCGRASDYACAWVCKCVHVSQLKEHLRNGWTLSSPSDAAKNNTSTSDLFSISMINLIPGNVALTELQRVSLKIFDVRGRLVKTITQNRMPEAHQIEWDKKDEAGNTISSGIYILQVNAGSYSATKKVVII